MPKWRCTVCGAFSYGWCGYHEYLRGRKLQCLYCGGERELVELPLRPTTLSPTASGNGKRETLLTT